MKYELIAELASNHGGNLDLALEMVTAAAKAGAHTVKIQSYTLDSLNSADPQADWLKEAHLDHAAHVAIMTQCQKEGVNFLSTPFDESSLRLLHDLGVWRVKIASSEAYNDWWKGYASSYLVSYPWGREDGYDTGYTRMTAIPLYPTPTEAVSAATLLDGWSDHTVGTAAAIWAMCRGCRIIEKHFSLPGKGRNMPWDADPEQLRQLRTAIDAVETIESGVGPVFRQRWLNT